MKSVRLHGTGKLKIHDEPVPVAGAGEKLIRITAVGCAVRICIDSQRGRSAMRS